jgi:hypothetical protein
VRLGDVAEQVAGLNVVVAGVEVAGVLEGEGGAADLGVDAEPRGLAGSSVWVTRSTIGMNWMKRAASSSRKNR